MTTSMVLAWLPVMESIWSRIDSCIAIPTLAKSTPNSRTTLTSMSYPPFADSETLTPRSDSFLEKKSVKPSTTPPPPTFTTPPTD